MTPANVHFGQAAELTRQRSTTLEAAFLANPNRFKHVAPRPPEVPLAAWINPPTKKEFAPTQQFSQHSLNSNAQVSQSH